MKNQSRSDEVVVQNAEDLLTCMRRIAQPERRMAPKLRIQPTAPTTPSLVAFSR